MRPREDVVGQRFGRLVVLERWIRQGRSFVRCLCDCGTEKTFQLNNLVSASTESCGCLRQQVSTKLLRSWRTFVHGEACRANVTPEYVAWCAMIQRCEYPKHDRWHRYGGRGITICAEWRNSYEAFLAHVGRRPTPSHSIDRYPNPDGNYEPGNVRWATRSEQAKNKSHG